MKKEVCRKCDNYDEGTSMCSRYKRIIQRVKSCGLNVSGKFNRPFNRKGMLAQREFMKNGRSPLHREG